MPTSDFVIRAARNEDLALLGPLELRAALRFEQSLHPQCVNLPHFDVSRLAELARGGSVWVAVTPTDVPVGFVIAEQLAGEAYVHELDVEPDYGGRGLGHRLLRRVAEWAQRDGLPSLLLATFADVPYNAPFYARLGFVVVPLGAYSAAMRRQREEDAAAGMPEASRVMMRAPVEELLARPE